MYDFKPGDKVQIDPALVNGGSRKSRGVGVVVDTHRASTETQVSWYGSTTYGEWYQTRNLVPVADTRGATR
jgi:hypothetical protein